MNDLYALMTTPISKTRPAVNTSFDSGLLHVHLDATYQTYLYATCNHDVTKRAHLPFPPDCCPYTAMRLHSPVVYPSI